MILRDFQYLDEGKLGQYLSQVESGLRQSASRSSNTKKTRRGFIGTGKLGGELGAELEAGHTESLIDTPEAQFDRLVGAVSGHHDEIGWVEVVSEADLHVVRPGSIVELDVELGEIEALSAIAPGGVMDQLGPVLAAMTRLGSASGLQNIPSEDQLESLKAIGASIPGRVLKAFSLVNDYTVFGVLHPHGNPGAIEGDARLVGKVRRVVTSGAWEPAPGMPLVSGLPREQRRAYAAKGPSAPNQEQFWIKGPAIEVDVLAIWS